MFGKYNVRDDQHLGSALKVVPIHPDENSNVVLKKRFQSEPKVEDEPTQLEIQ